MFSIAISIFNGLFVFQTPNVEKLSDLFGEQSLFQEGKPTMPDTSHMPAMMKEVASRSYASWLNWWKNTVNSDDYMKYISTQVRHRNT